MTKRSHCRQRSIESSYRVTTKKECFLIRTNIVAPRTSILTRILSNAVISEKSFPWCSISRGANDKFTVSFSVGVRKEVTQFRRKRFRRQSRELSTINYPRVQISQIITQSDTLTLHLYDVPVFGVNQLDLGLVWIRMFERGARRSGINSVKRENTTMHADTGCPLTIDDTMTLQYVRKRVERRERNSFVKQSKFVPKCDNLSNNTVNPHVNILCAEINEKACFFFVWAVIFKEISSFVHVYSINFQTRVFREWSNLQNKYI